LLFNNNNNNNNHNNKNNNHYVSPKGPPPGHHPIQGELPGFITVSFPIPDIPPSAVKDTSLHGVSGTEGKTT